MARLNLTVDDNIPEILERLAGGRNKMGDYLSKIINEMDQGAPADVLERMDKEGLRLMVQGMGGRLKSLEGEIVLLQSQVAALTSGRLMDGRR